MPPPNDASWFGAHSRSGPSFHEVLTEAVADICENGFDSEERIALWVQRIREAAERSLIAPDVLKRMLDAALQAIFRSKIDRGGILKLHPGVSRFTLQQVAPKLRSELDRRIMASAGLIKLNRERMIADTIQRFSGWATSIPVGGTDAASRREVKEEIRKPLASLPFRERRVMTDQGHKFVAGLSEIIAVDAGALAGHWRSHYMQAGYDYRPDHKHFDVVDQFFVVRDNWAIRAGLMKVDGYRYTDQIERPAELVYCRCWYEWKYNLRSLPAGMLTKKGKDELAKARIAA